MSCVIMFTGYDSPKDEEGGTDGEERSAPPRRYRPRRRYEYGGYRGGRGGGRGGGGGHTSGDEVSPTQHTFRLSSLWIYHLFRFRKSFLHYNN